MNTGTFTKSNKVNRGGAGMCRMHLMRIILCISLFILPLSAVSAVWAAPDPSSVTLNGYLLTSCCYFGKAGSPASHGRGCLKMPACAHTGYGIAVLNSQGEYDFCFFDGVNYPASAGDPAASGGQALARAIAETSIKSNHIAISVTGTWSGATRTQILHDGTQGGGFAEMNVTNLQEVSTVTPVPADLTGYIIDEDCFTGNPNPGSDSIMCLKMAECAASGYGIAVAQNDGTYRFAYFDGTFASPGVLSTGGQFLAANLLADTQSEDHVTIHVTGQYTGEKIKNTAGTNNNTLYPVFAVESFAEVIAPALTSAPTPSVTPSTAPASLSTASPTVSPTPETAVEGISMTKTPSANPTAAPADKSADAVLGVAKTGENDTKILVLAGVILALSSAGTIAFVLGKRRQQD